MIPPNATLFISDLHLSPDAPYLQDLFNEFLKGPAKGAKKLYILGDLFDMWIGEDIQTNHQTAVARSLRELATQGTELFFMGGNRDFLVTHAFLNKAHCRKIPDPYLMRLNGTSILLTHGDRLCTQDISYQRYRKIAQHPIMRFAVLYLPNFVRQKLAHQLRNKSKMHQAGQAPEILDVEPTSAINMMQRYQVRQLIHGHVHRPKIHTLQVKDQSAQRLVMGDWHKTASFLVCTTDRITLASFSPNEGVRAIESCSVSP